MSRRLLKQNQDKAWAQPSGDGGSRELGRPPPFDPHVSGENIAAVLVDSLSNGFSHATDEQDETTTQE